MRLLVLSVGFQYAVKKGITRESYVLQQVSLMMLCGPATKLLNQTVNGDGQIRDSDSHRPSLSVRILKLGVGGITSPHTTRS